MRPGSVCAALRRTYRERVCAFLRAPPAAWMRACGYDVDFVRFSRDCASWRRALEGGCGGGFEREEGPEALRTPKRVPARTHAGGVAPAAGVVERKK
jgi:hypothetical protein